MYPQPSSAHHGPAQSACGKVRYCGAIPTARSTRWFGQMKLVSSLLTVVLITAELAGAGVANGQPSDYGAATCGNFLASGHDNMAVIIWRLRGASRRQDGS